MKICQITGKRALMGNKVSHSNKKTKKIFSPNLKTKKFFLEEESRWVTLKVSAHGMRIINTKGLGAALKGAKGLNNIY